jgi:hypothetical protein
MKPRSRPSSAGAGAGVGITASASASAGTGASVRGSTSANADARRGGTISAKKVGGSIASEPHTGGLGPREAKTAPAKVGVSDPKGETANVQSAETTAEVDVGSAENVIDLSGKALDSHSLSMTLLESAKGSAIDAHQVLLASHCGLEDDCMQALAGPLAHPLFIAFDLSHNSLRETFFSNLSSVLKVGGSATITAGCALSY